MSHKTLKNELQTIIDNTYGDTLETEVAKEALQYEDIAGFFNDLATHGCVSGWVSSLVFYSDTHKFYDKHYDEIEDLRVDFEDMIGSPITIKHDLKNFYAWFAFEVTASRMAEDLGIEV